MSALRTALLPALFVLLWSSGYAACKAAVLHAGSFTVLSLRCAGALLLLTLIAWLSRAPWPRQPVQWLHLTIAGVLIHALYLGINFHAAADGFPVGITALIGALQPLATALAAAVWLKEPVRAREWAGLAIGLAGVFLVLSDRVAFDWARLPQASGIGFAMLCLTAGTLYQKRFCGFMDWRTGLAVQLIVPTAILLAGAVSLESFTFDPQPQFLGAIVWLIALSSAVYGLLHALFKRGASASAASLLYLVPVATSTFMYLMFEERLGGLAIGGMGLTIAGVASAQMRAAPLTRATRAAS